MLGGFYFGGGRRFIIEILQDTGSTVVIASGTAQCDCRNHRNSGPCPELL